MSLSVFITCKQCRIEKQPILVPMRQDGESIKTWMDNVGLVIYALHRSEYPMCTALVDVMIPLTKNAPIGSTTTEQ